MSCYHPLKAFQVGYNPSGKPKYKICSYDVECVYVKSDGSSFASSVRNYSPLYRCIEEFIEIPCGKCIGCRLEYSRQWANRCMLELQEHDSSYFCTFTYDDAHLPISYYADPDTGEAIPCATLVKRDFQLLMKRIRKEFDSDKIRFFGCGEYGSSTLRPHLHIILFGLHLDDLKYYKRSPQGYDYFNSPRLQSCWKKGYVVVGEVNWQTCAYVARYVTKKLTGNLASFYSDFNIEPPFILMSRKPGIARNYYDENADNIYKYDNIVLSNPEKPLKFKPPRYYDKLFDIDNPVQSAIIKKQRKVMAENARQLKLSKTDLPYLDLLEVEENVKLEQIKSLKRNL